MLELAEVIDELSTVFEKPIAEKLGQVMLSVYERLHESLVLQRLDVLERRIDNLADEWRRSHAELAQRVEEQLAMSRMETDARFAELAEAQRRTEQRLEELAEFQRRAYEEFQEYRKQTDARFAELAEAQRRLAEEFAEYRKLNDTRFTELAEAQRRTEQRLEELAEFQRRAYEEFQEYRKQTDARFAELAEAQQRTEQRLEELAEFQRRAYEEFQEYRKQTDARFAELAEAQHRTAQEVANLTQEMRALAKSHKDLQKQVGGMSVSFGYVLENEAIKKLPALLLQDHGIQVEGKLKRQFVRDRMGREIEVNLFGTGRRNGETITIVGESKSQLSKNDVNRFLRRTLISLEGVYPKLFPVMVTHMISEPSVEAYAREQGVAVYYSFDL